MAATNSVATFVPFPEFKSVVDDLCSDYTRVPYDPNRDRYEAFTPYVHNQVVVGDEGTNGSRILFNDGLSETQPHGYIAISAPLPNYFSTFMRMLFSEKAPLIVSLTDFTEDGVPKADQYLPYEAGEKVYTHGQYLLQCQEVHPSTPLMAGWNLEERDYLLAIRGAQYPRNKHYFTQMHLPHWKDWTPGAVTGVFQLVKKVHEFWGSHTILGPTVVHCSAGVGRTGTFINCSVAYERVQTGLPVSSFEIAKCARQQRTWLGGNQYQYQMVERFHRFAVVERHRGMEFADFLTSSLGEAAQMGVFSLLLHSGSCPDAVLKNAYDSLSVPLKELLKYQIYIANGMSLSFEGEERENLGEFIVSHALRSDLVKMAANVSLTVLGKTRLDFSETEKQLSLELSKVGFNPKWKESFAVMDDAVKWGVIGILLRSEMIDATVLREFYDALPVVMQNELKYEIFVANRESIHFDGADREDLGQYVVDHQIRADVVKKAVDGCLAKLGRERLDLIDEDKALLIASLHGEIRERDIVPLADLFRKIEDPSVQMRAFHAAFVNRCSQPLLRALYDALPMDRQLFFKEQIWRANGQSNLFLGEEREDLGEYVVQNALSSEICIQAAKRSIG